MSLPPELKRAWQVRKRELESENCDLEKEIDEIIESKILWLRETQKRLHTERAQCFQDQLLVLRGLVKQLANRGEKEKKEKKARDKEVQGSETKAKIDTAYVTQSEWAERLQSVVRIGVGYNKTTQRWVVGTRPEQVKADISCLACKEGIGTSVHFCLRLKPYPKPPPVKLLCYLSPESLASVRLGVLPLSMHGIRLVPQQPRGEPKPKPEPEPENLKRLQLTLNHEWREGDEIEKEFTLTRHTSHAGPIQFQVTNGSQINPSLPIWAPLTCRRRFVLPPTLDAQAHWSVFGHGVGEELLVFCKGKMMELLPGTGTETKTGTVTKTGTGPKTGTGAETKTVSEIGLAFWVGTWVVPGHGFVDVRLDEITGRSTLWETVSRKARPVMDCRNARILDVPNPLRIWVADEAGYAAYERKTIKENFVLSSANRVCQIKSGTSLSGVTFARERGGFLWVLLRFRDKGRFDLQMWSTKTGEKVETFSVHVSSGEYTEGIRAGNVEVEVFAKQRLALICGFGKPKLIRTETENGSLPLPLPLPLSLPLSPCFARFVASETSEAHGIEFNLRQDATGDRIIVWGKDNVIREYESENFIAHAKGTGSER